MWQMISLIFSILVAMALFNLLISKNIFEKLVALDVITLFIIFLLISLSILFKRSFLLDLALAYALLSFIGILYFAKYGK